MRFELDDHWYPHGARTTSGPPDIGALVAWNHAAWRVVETKPVPETEWTDAQRHEVAVCREDRRWRHIPVTVVVRPVRITSDDPRARDHDIHLRPRNSYTTWHVYPDEHYPICASCLEPLPCREKSAERIAEREINHMSRYETPGVCPACEEVVSARQKAHTFQQNLHVLGGPPVTFHVGRRGCRYDAAEYERKLIASDSSVPRVLSCAGHLTNHNDGTYDCTALNECPGPLADHPSYSTCRCPDCHAGGRFGCRPEPTARRNGADVDGLS